MQSKSQITKLFPVEELLAYHQQAHNITKPLVDKFLGKLRTTYDLVFRQFDNTSRAEKILMKGAPDLQALRQFWANQIKQDNFTDLKYPNDTFLDHVKSLSTPKDPENTSGFEQRDTSVKVKSTIEANKNNGSRASFNKTRTLNDDRSNDVQPLELLMLQDEEAPDAKAEVEIVTPGTTIRLSTTVGQHLIEWLGSILSLTYSVYSKLSAAACGHEKKTP